MVSGVRLMSLGPLSPNVGFLQKSWEDDLEKFQPHSLLTTHDPEENRSFSLPTCVFNYTEQTLTGPAEVTGSPLNQFL